MSNPDLSNVSTRNLGRRFEENARSEYFCQWCYDRGLRYPDNGKPWTHARDCPNLRMEIEWLRRDTPWPSVVSDENAALRAELEDVKRERALLQSELDEYKKNERRD